MADLKDKVLKAAELLEDELDDVAGGINVEAIGKVASLVDDSKEYVDKVRSVGKALKAANNEKFRSVDKAADADKEASFKDLSIAKAVDADKIL